MGDRKGQEEAVHETVSDIWRIRRRLEKGFHRSRELSLTLTKLDEAAMWAKQIPIELDAREDG